MVTADIYLYLNSYHVCIFLVLSECMDRVVLVCEHVETWLLPPPWFIPICWELKHLILHYVWAPHGQDLMIVGICLMVPNFKVFIMDLYASKCLHSTLIIYMRKARQTETMIIGTDF